MAAGNYVYRNSLDTRRFVIERRAAGWNVYDWTRESKGNYQVVSYADAAGALFRTKRDALEFVRESGGVVCINPATVTEGWA